MEELKPCPFCGGEAEMGKIHRQNEDGSHTLCSSRPDSEFKWEYHVECKKCWSASGPWMKTKKGAVNKWNRRVVD